MDSSTRFLFFALVQVVQAVEGQLLTTSAPGSEPEVATSCLSRCDESYIPNLACYCNELCGQFENCCEDYFRQCKPEYVWTEEWSDYGGHSYKYFSNTSITGVTAKQACREKGAMLVSINDREEMDFIVDRALKKRVLTAYTGATDQLQEGKWMWQDGTVTPTPGDMWEAWYEGEPDNAQDSQHCQVITNYKYWVVLPSTLSRYWWRDESCEVNPQLIQGYICEGTLQCEPNPCQNNGKCVYVGGAQEYDCHCSQRYVGNHCEIELIPGQIWKECGGTLSESEGLIISPLFPKPYPPLAHCEWTIEAEKGKTISVSVEDVDIEAGKDCSYDGLQVFDGPYTNSSLLMAPLCGSLIDTGSSVTSTGSEVLIKFYSDHSVNQRGFKLRYRQERCGLGVGDSGCGTRQTFTSSCGVIDINQGPGDTPCSWNIIVPEGNVVNLTFTEFFMGDQDAGCEKFHLGVYDGGDPGAPLVGKFCGKRFPWSLQSISNQLHLVLQDGSWISDQHHIAMEFAAIESSAWQTLSPVEHLSGHSGQLAAVSSPVQVRLAAALRQVWRLAVAPGDRIQLTWTCTAHLNATLQVYGGYSELSGLLIHQSFDESNRGTEMTQTLLGPGFQVLVILTRSTDDHDFNFEAQFMAVDWLPELSGCYRPLYYNNPTSPGTENNRVRQLEPVVLMVSDQSYDSDDPGYGAGLYCKWLIQGQEGNPLSLEVLNANVQPLVQDCGYDGLVVYDGNSTADKAYGPFCGHSSFPMEPITAGDTLLVVFYSDRRGAVRSNGILRAIVHQTGMDPYASDLGDCSISYMESSASEKLDSACGVLLSPYFPGLVQPGVWTWTFAGDYGIYFDVNVYYVRGPDVQGECLDYFQVVEVPHDSGELHQTYTALMKVCGDVNVFLPPKKVKSPPGQKMRIVLNTIKMTLPRKWEFKVAFQLKEMETAKYRNTSGDSQCDEEEVYYRGHCYLYTMWTLRHYEPTAYRYLETWQGSYDYCRQRNSTLLTLQDEDEALFIKYTLSNPPWFWHPAATWQANHRLIFLGLTNKNGHYEWVNGAQLGYADWYVPLEDWEQNLFHEDTLIEDLLNLDSPQPNADLGSLCTAAVSVSPFGSLNWAKIPCEYPIFRAGVICKRPTDSSEDILGHATNKIAQQQLLENYRYGYLGCRVGWMKVGDRCLTVLTNYSLIPETAEESEVHEEILSFDDATSMCEHVGGSPSSTDPAEFEKIQLYLRLWRHEVFMGDIWLSGDATRCNVIQVMKDHLQDDKPKYQLASLKCKDAHYLNIKNVICETYTTVFTEGCEQHEFQCANDVCISADHVCDGDNTCGDGSDEMGCACGEDTFECANGRCISLSLFCDFIDHCGDNSDEIGCVMETCRPGVFRCANGQCVDASVTCDFKQDCQDGSDEAEITCGSACRGFQCYSGQCLRPELRQDLVSDCPGLALEDEVDRTQELLTVFDVFFEGISHQNKTVVRGCREDGDDFVQCRPGFPQCFSRGTTCHYGTDLADETRNYQVQSSCRDGAHLRNECENIECPGMYHCPGSYCVPYSKVCDGFKDCPLGHDEISCTNYTCPGLFRCKGVLTCIPHSQVCDGKVQCPKHKDDEKYCDNIDVLCHNTSCTCNGYTLSCIDKGMTLLPVSDGPETRYLRGITFSQNQIILSKNTFSGFHWLGRLNLTYNSISSIPEGVFKDLFNLFELDLSNNMLQALSPGLFKGLGKLQKLNLNNNRLWILRREHLAELTSIIHLIISDNQLDDVTQDAFADVQTLNTLNSDAYKFCCIAKHVDTCTPAPDEFSSCEDLMDNYALQVSIWVLGWCATLGNVFVVAWRLRRDRTRASSLFIISLGCSDFFMGVYMLIIGSVDSYYRGQYIIYADRWRSSWLCQFAGILAMLSSEVSVFMLTVITLDRAAAILFPLKVQKFRPRHAVMISACGWVACLFLSILPTFNMSYFGDAFFGRSGVCLPFQVSTEKLPGWEYSVFIFLVVNLLSFIIIFISYAAIFSTVKTSIKQMGDKSTSSADEYALAKKLMLVVITDFLCWVPIILIGFASLAGANVPPQVSAWIAVFILPLNSAMNPILYTISSIDCSKRKKKKRPSMATSSMSLSTSKSLPAPPAIKQPSTVA